MDTKDDLGAAREDLTELEQVRWVLETLLEIQDLHSVWPIRVVLTREVQANPNSFVLRGGQYVLTQPASRHIPLDQAARILLDANSPRLPADAEGGLLKLFSTLEAQGSHVLWGGPVSHPDLAWARMQLFASRFEYQASFHVLVSSLKNGSSLRVAERNAFGKDPDALEAEARKNLAAGQWQPVSVWGRPLDPKRDLGEHSVDAALIDTFIADAELEGNPKSAEAAYKAGIEAGGPAKAHGFAGLAELARRDEQDAKPFLDQSIKAGSTNAQVYVAAAEGSSPDEAIRLLKRAAQLNPQWAQPVYLQAEIMADPGQKEALLKKAASMDPRQTRYWFELARLEASDGHALEAQGSWLRAEDSAATDEERTKIHEARLNSEQDRLDAADQERIRAREASHLADQRAQDAEASRIRAAERSANSSVDQIAEAPRPDAVTSWDSAEFQRKLEGVLTQVDCGRAPARITVKDHSGKAITLTMQSVKDSGLSCGSQRPARRVSLSFRAAPDDQAHTAGQVLSLQLQ